MHTIMFVYIFFILKLTNVCLQEMQARQEQGPMIVGGDSDMTAKLAQLQNEVTAKKQEITSLREQVRFIDRTMIKLN